MTEQLNTISHEHGVRLKKHAYEDQQASRRRRLGLGQGMTDRQRIQADHEAGLDLQMTRISRLAQTENELKGLSWASRPETMSLVGLQLELTEMFATTFARPPRRAS